MNPIWVEESGIRLGPFSSDRLFQIEHSNSVKKLGTHIQLAEFVLLSPDGKSLWVVEAKSSIPSKERSPEKYAKYFDEICQKLTNSLDITATALLSRNSGIYNELPDELKDTDWEQLSIKLRLIIPDLPDAYAPILSDVLHQKLIQARKPWLRTWRIHPQDIKVLNQKLVIKEQLSEQVN